MIDMRGKETSRGIFAAGGLIRRSRPCLHMLNAIHDKFGGSDGLFGRLIDEEQPAITFQLLDLENFGLSDDLYIKMTARGKPLTAFETFKARYEQELANQLHGETFSIGTQSFDASDYIARRMDTTWADLFWKHRKAGSDLYDEAFMHVFRAVALISRDPESPEYLRDFTKLRTGVAPHPILTSTLAIGSMGLDALPRFCGWSSK
jgi:hypothetical protein